MCRIEGGTRILDDHGRRAGLQVQSDRDLARLIRGGTMHDNVSHRLLYRDVHGAEHGWWQRAARRVEPRVKPRQVRRGLGQAQDGAALGRHRHPRLSPR